jgi:hypothetical protein
MSYTRVNAFVMDVSSIPTLHQVTPERVTTSTGWYDSTGMVDTVNETSRDDVGSGAVVIVVDCGETVWSFYSNDCS